MRYSLSRGTTTRCDLCGRKKSAKTRKHYWGYADIVPDDTHRERLLNRISSCLQRCENPRNSQWYNYGKRGIRVYPDWVKDRRAFLSYIVSLDGWDDPILELDRIDNNRGYEPGNLRFISRRENTNNRRTIPEMQSIIESLEAEVARLRRELRGTKESLYDPD